MLNLFKKRKRPQEREERLIKLNLTPENKIFFDLEKINGACRIFMCKVYRFEGDYYVSSFTGIEEDNLWMCHVCFTGGIIELKSRPE